MSTSRSNKRLAKPLTAILVFLFWISIWWLAALIVGDEYFLPSPIDTLLSLIGLFGQKSFYKVVFLSLVRVLSGLIFGTAVGMILAFVCHRFKAIRSLVSPIISILKAMPVATFILLLWITLRGSALTIFIGFIMVMPIIFQNTTAGLDSIDKDLIEVTKVFGFGFIKKLKLLILPSLKSYIFPAVITSVGLAFKSQIAAEIIAYTKNSIGQYIYDANYSLNTGLVFAWAVVIVSFSIGLENICRYLLRRV